MESHAAHPNDRALFNPLTVKQTIENCGACHSRREELDGNFHVGDALLDHYRISLPEQAGLYYPDGQVKDEDFEYGSFLMSRMGQKGITCLDCHNPHSGRLLAPVENNALCMTCHTPPGQRGAIPVDLATHTHHQPGTPGDRCVDCHMPVTTYMGRDPRRDHGFTIPDPVLTKELGVPNSCNRCHADQTADWAIEFTSKGYGDKMKRRSRERALLISRAEKHDGSAVPELVSMAKSEDNSAWRAVIASDLTPWASQEEVRGYLEKSLSDESPLVRSAAVRALSNEPGTAAILKPLCDDAVRLVRLDAAWGMHDTRDRSRPSYKELIAYLDTISDQPAGALRKTQLALDEQRMDDALEWSAKASAWDATSGGAHQVHALVLNAAGKPNEAIQELRRASDLEPKNAQYPFMLALLYGGEGQTDDVIGQLKKAISIDPAFGRAWYNLGLALAKQGQLTESIAALRRAETLLPDTPEIPYARATVHARAGQLEEARDAATRAQALGYSPAAELLRRLFPPGSGSPANR
jgi:predicted CXXCH cytochrome family protein